jgi:hypothetical protein
MAKKPAKIMLRTSGACTPAVGDSGHRRGGRDHVEQADGDQRTDEQHRRAAAVRAFGVTTKGRWARTDEGLERAQEDRQVRSL